MKKQTTEERDERDKNFVRIWQGAATLTDAASALGLEPRKATFRAYFLRLRGVPLKKFSTTRRPINTEELKTLANEYNRAAAAELEPPPGGLI